MTKPIGADAALRSFIIRGDICKKCVFLGDDCENVMVTVKKRLGGMLDPHYFMVIEDCDKFMPETRTIEELKDVSTR